ncbi:hypothetical protein [Photobacterium kishitanii]|nr:hypothetical protein [Photobacterium kishitanii]
MNFDNLNELELFDLSCRVECHTEILERFSQLLDFYHKKGIMSSADYFKENYSMCLYGVVEVFALLKEKIAYSDMNKRFKRRRVFRERQINRVGNNAAKRQKRLFDPNHVGYQHFPDEKIFLDSELNFKKLKFEVDYYFKERKIEIDSRIVEIFSELDPDTESGLDFFTRIGFLRWRQKA